MIASSIQSLLQRYQQIIDPALRKAIDRAQQISGTTALGDYYNQMRYHLGWVDPTFAPIENNAGKLLRPTLLLSAYEAVGATNWPCAVPAAVAVELTHNFTLIHDDIEDGDIERRHRPTLWKLWGVPQAINTGDGMFALARRAIWETLDYGVDIAIVAQLCTILDSTVQTIAEGQYLDLRFETLQTISVAMYVDMISRKTAALMRSAAEMGALLGTHEQETIERLRNFGQAIGLAFQVRDDMLGIWAKTAESGKTAAGDIYRRKKSLPILHALEHASAQDQQILYTIYQNQMPITQDQLENVLTILEHTQSKNYCQTFLHQQCGQAHAALAQVPHHDNPTAKRALADLETLVLFVENIRTCHPAQADNVRASPYL